MDLEYKIGLVGASGSGKTSLLTAIYLELQKRLTGSPIQFTPSNSVTQNVIDSAQVQFKTCITNKGVTWTPPRFHSTTDLVTLEFTMTILVKGQTHHIHINFLDYPGGMLGNTQFAASVTPYLLECDAIFLPISSDILMEWYNNNGKSEEESQRRCIAALEILNSEAACRVVDNWMSAKCRQMQTAQLFFVPVRCEKWFTDNLPSKGILGFIGGLFQKSPSDDLFKAVDEQYYQQLNYSSGMAELVQVGVYCVDTYGIIEQCQMDIRQEGGCDILVPQFKRREGMGRLVKIKNAVELINSVLLKRFNETKSQWQKQADSEKLQKDNYEIALKQKKDALPFLKSMLGGTTPEIEDLKRQLGSVTADWEKHTELCKTMDDILNLYSCHACSLWGNSVRTKIYNPEKD